jgi:hypothetical protein
MSADDSLLLLIKTSLIQNGEYKNVPFSLSFDKIVSNKVYLFDDEKNIVIADLLNLRNEAINREERSKSLNKNKLYRLKILLEIRFETWSIEYKFIENTHKITIIMVMESDDFSLKLNILDYLENLKQKNDEISSIIFNLRKKLMQVFFSQVFF